MSTKEKEISYPEHEKLKAVSEQSQHLFDFMEWLQSEKYIEFARYAANSDHLHPFRFKTQDLLAEYFGVDLKQLEQEKRRMLDEIRNENT